MLFECPLKIESLHKTYGQNEAVKGVGFELREGEVFGLLGPNGAGKTSVISCIVTLEKPTSGEITVFGHNVQTHALQAKSLIGFVPQELISHGFFNVEEILQFHSGYFGVTKNKERIDFLLKRLSLWEHRHKKVRQLSGGMKRRLLVAKALVHRPKLLLLDEPTAGVDIELRESLWEFVRELQSEGTSILLTTHYLEEAEGLCNRVGILDLGELLMVGETSKLIKKLTHRRVTFSMKSNTKPVTSLANHSLLMESSDNSHVFRLPYSMTLADLLSDLDLNLSEVRDLKIQEGSLEEAFRSVLGSDHGTF